ncbi:cilia- and flagella-associated protein 90-like [Babylonia areolata]|uniref:cilia- and flagella-associated protein 90-like n=1 Tax=Babylonia areolata TaxID=304850 RepID=UPI003FD10878
MAAKEHVLQVQTVADNYTLYGRPCEVSAFSFIPTERNEPAERTVFNSTKKEKNAHHTYDRLFRKVDGYNNKLHRDDREHAKSRGLQVNDEEKLKEVPTLASSEYGHRLENNLDPPDREHVRIGYVQSEFYRRNKIQ